MFSLMEVLSKCLPRTSRQVLGVKIGCYPQIWLNILFRPVRKQPVYVREVPLHS